MHSYHKKEVSYNERVARWKTLKVYLLERKGVVVNSPKDAFRQAFAQQLIGHEEQWIAFVDMRNKTVHHYNEKTAEDI